MAKSKWRWLSLFVPLATLLICVLIHIMPIDPQSLWFQLCADLAFVGGSVSATLALLFAFDAHRATHRADQLPAQEQPGTSEQGSGPVRRRRRLPVEEEERRIRRIRQLERQVEILASMRDLSLIANDEAEFEGVLTRSLDILQSLFEATEIQVFLIKEKAPDALLLAGLRRKKHTLFGRLDEPLRSIGTREQALDAIQDGLGGTRFVGQRLNAHVVLRADQEVIGVLSVFIPRRSRDRSWALGVYFELGQIAKHMALVINKPTLYDRAVLDALTGLYSKRHYLDQVPKAMSAARRLGTPLALVILDVDHFKRVNDQYGHVTGDIVLAAVGRTIRESIRDYDVAYRYGGEEICIVAPNTSYEAALLFAERLRQALEEQRIVGDQGQALKITASLGVCLWTPEMAALSDFMTAADEWLYRAKQDGRNQVRPCLEEITRHQK
jgi:diguanylate cyclase (GGDEF)-like protein